MLEHCFTDKTYGTIWMHFEMKCSQYLLNISPLSQTCEINRNLLFFLLKETFNNYLMQRDRE